MGFRLPNVESLRNEVESRWDNGHFIDHTAAMPPREYVGIPWVPYEQFMLAQIVRSVVNQVGLLNVRFPAYCTEDNSLHVHAHSDRRVTVIEGNGFFVAERNGIVGAEPIAPGSIVFMPRNSTNNRAEANKVRWYGHAWRSSRSTAEAFRTVVLRDRFERTSGSGSSRVKTSERGRAREGLW